MTSATQSAAPLALLLALHPLNCCEGGGGFPLHGTFTPFMSVKKKAPTILEKKKKRENAKVDLTLMWMFHHISLFLIPYRIEKDKIGWSYGERKKLLFADSR